MSDEVWELIAHNPSRIVFRNDKLGLCQNSSYSTLDTETIETFTLEGFRELLVSYLKEDRDFIIARVTTQDSSTSIIFYSYYSAIELNKILFCIENNNNLLYRIKARNPINNLKIVGDVSYYKVTPEILRNAIDNSKLKQTGMECGQQHQHNSLETQNPGDSNLAEEKSQPNSGSRELPGCGNTSQSAESTNDEIVIEAEYFASDEDLLFDLSTRKYFAGNFPNEKEYFPRRFELIESSATIVDERAEDDHDDKFSLKIILYTNIGTILTVFGMCMFFGSNEIFLTAIAPLTLTLFFSVFFLVLYVVLFETPEGFTSIFSLRKTESV